MNKKIIVLPLAVVACGLASCNNSWPTLSEEDAISRASTVFEFQKTLENLNSSTYEDSSTYKTKYSDKELVVESNWNISVDVSKKYYKSYTKSKITNDGKTYEYSGTHYFLVKDNKYYEVIDYLADGESTEKGKIIYDSEDEFEKYFVTYAYSYYEMEYINDEFYYGTGIDLSNLKESIDEYKQIQEEIKDKEGQYFNYSFTSNGDHNFGFKLDKSIIDDEYNITETENCEHIIENGIYVSSSSSYTMKFEDSVCLESKSSSRLNPNAGVSVDNVDLDKYPTIE